MTMTLVSTVTVGSGGAASIDFTSIPQTGTDLLVVVSTRGTTGGSNALFMAINSVSTNQSISVLRGNGSTAASYTDTAIAGLATVSTYTADTFSSSQFYITNYSASTNKAISIDAVNENNATTATQNLNAGLWSSTAAITSLSFTISGANHAQYSTASLYTITKGSGGATVS